MWNPQGNRKVGRPKYTWRRELQNELKKEINKTLSEASTVATSKEKWKDLVPTLYLEINGNDDELIVPLRQQNIKSSAAATPSKNNKVVTKAYF